MKRLVFFLTLLMFAAVQVLQAQAVEITGTVTSSEDGSPVPGASIIVKGTTIGTVSSSEGTFRLRVPEDATELVVSFVGMKTLDVRIEGRNQIDIVMEPDILGLDEVVVTALGIPREKKSLGYSVQEITSDEVNRGSNPNLLTNLSGKFAGVEVRQSSGMPGAPSTIMIRGARSFAGNNQPLYVVDGQPIESNPDYSQNVTGAYYSGRALDINPNDIESINVLKGQAAAALYGIRASNGVILITTKSGRTTAAGKPTVNLISSYTADKIAVLPDRQNSWAQGYWGWYDDPTLYFIPAFSYSWGPKISDLPDDLDYGGNNFGQPGLFFDPYKGEWVTPKGYDNPVDFFQTGGTFYNGVSISNSAELGSYLVGFGATNQEGIMRNSGMDRYNAKLSATVNLGKKWQAGFTGNYSDVSLRKKPSGNSSWLFTVYGSPPSFDLNGTPYHMEGPLGEYRQISYRRGAVGENPRWADEYNKFLESTSRFFGNTWVEWDATSWLNVRYQIGVDTYSTDNEDIYQAGSTSTGELLPAGNQYPDPLNPDRWGYRPPKGGSINNYGLGTTNLNSLLNVTLSKDFGNLGTILIVGNEFRDENTRSWTMTGLDFTIPGWNNMSNTTTQFADESKSRYRSAGTYANLTLEYMSMLFLNATGRYDIVSGMPRDNRSFFYPSVSLGFVFTELGPLQGNTFLPYGKLRVSFAQVGQAGRYLDPYYVQGGAGSGFLNDGIVFPLGGISGFKPSRLIIDPNLVPQNTSNYEIGVELKFLNNRLGIDYTYSDQTATDQIFDVPMAGSTGYSTFRTNAGEMNSKSHEIMFYAMPVRLASGFEWNMTANFTKIKNTVIELAPGIESVSLAGYVTPNVRASEGDTYPAIYGETIMRDDQGRILIDDDPASIYYGFPMSGGFGKIGDVSPDFIIGFTNTFRFKWITLDALFNWKQGGEIYSGTNRLMGLYGTPAFTEDRESPFMYEDTNNAKGTGYLSDGSVNNIERGGPGDIFAYADFYNDTKGSIDEMNVYETSYIKLREVALRFQLPASVVALLRMQAASISLVGRNFLLWSTLPNVDPETSQGMGNGVMGFEYVSLPQTKSYGVTLNLTF
jgi:TonB-linked SusC/RagA family outer membrane protein